MVVRWTKPATDDLTNICDYSEERFGIAQARRAALTIHDPADSLREMPFLGRTGSKPGTRELPICGLPMLIIYRVGKEAVEIVRILHGARQWP
jgi:toxin ParE1/3/4